MAEARAVERRIVTVLFADLVGFTTLSEQLDAEDVALVQDAYFESVRETIGRHGGQLEKFIGDAAMAVFGVPRARDDDAERAIRAGLALVAAVERLAAQLGLEDGALRLRVGVNSGETLFGEASAERGPVTGDVVNTAARLQAAAAPGSVVVGELTAFSVAESVELEALAPLELKGKAEPVRAFHVARFYAERSRDRALGNLRAPMLGRESELARLAAAVGEGAACTVIVAPPGTGKSRLLAELATRMLARQAVVLQARVRPDALAPYEAVAQLVRAAGGREGLRRAATGTPAARLEALLLALEPLEAEWEPGARGERRERDAFFGDWVEALDLLSAGRPALWLVEDVHWASGDLLAFLAAARSAPRQAGRLVVATARPSFLEGEGVGGAELLELPPLGDGVTAELVAALVGEALPGDLVERIVDEADGNPLFVEELLRMWADVGVLRHDGETWTLVAEPEAVPLPATVQAIYAAQLDDLPDAARTAARRAAVAGRRFPRSACAPLRIVDADAALGVLVRRALVDGPHDDELLGESYAYRHALLRDAGYASLARGERASLHCRLADWLTELPGAAGALAQVIGRHYAAAAESAPALVPAIEGRSRAELRAEAAGWFERAADAALRVAAWESARELAARSLELDEEAPAVTAGRRLELQAEATASAMGVDPAIELLDEAIARYRSALPTEPEAARAGLASAGLAQGTLLRAQTWFTRAGRLAEELLDEIGPEAEPPARSRLLLLRATAILNASDDYERAERDATLALELARAAGDRSLELDVTLVLAQIAAERDGSAADDAWRRIEELGRVEGRWSSVAAALRTRGLSVVDDDPEAAVELFDRSAEICSARGLVEAGAWCDHGRAEAAFVVGDWDHALETGLRAVAAGEHHAFHRVVVRSWFVLLPIARYRGRRDLLEQAHGRFAARRGREPDSPYARIVTTAAHLDFAAVGLEPPFVPDVAERLASFEGAHGGPSWLAALQTVVDAWLEAGELEGAADALDRMAVSGESTTLARATEAILRARLLRADGDAPGAAAHAERALELLAGRAPWWRLRALETIAAVGDGRARDEARALARRLRLEP
jgi:class 3 adenylate cyclase/tetratricopeptide (TPR) repeat protein